MVRLPLVATFLLACVSLSAQTVTRAVFEFPNPPLEPSDRLLAEMAYDPIRDRVVMVGGHPPGGGNIAVETWEFDGANWELMPAVYQPNWNSVTRLVYAEQLGQVIAVRGHSTVGGYPLRILGWTGTTWEELSYDGPVTMSDWYQVAWDSHRGVLVVHGSPNTAETWEWDGATWEQKGFGGPLPRELHGLVYDELRQVTVLYGGRPHSGSPYDDMWEWNGAYWLQRFGLPAPPSTVNFTMAYEPERQSIILHGGQLDGTETGEVYEFDGFSWSEVEDVGGPSMIEHVAMAYMQSTRRFVLFGGMEAATWHKTRTIKVRTGTIASSVTHGPGCAGPNGTPFLVPIAGDRPVLGEPWRLAFGLMPYQPTLPVFGALAEQDQHWNGAPLPVDLTPVGFTGCSLNIAFTEMVGLQNTLGTAAWTIMIPLDPALDGVKVFAQGAGLAPGWNPAGIVLSNSIVGTMGAL